QAASTLATRCNGTDQDAFADSVPSDSVAQFVNYPDRFVSNDKAGTHFVLALHNVNVSSANRRQGDSNDGVSDACSGNRYVFNCNLVWAVKHKRPHCCNGL